MLVFKFLRVCVHLLVGLWTCATVFPFVSDAKRSQRIQRWSVKLLAICGIELDIMHKTAEPMALRALVVANHISWLDIFVINALHPCCFVAKSEIRGWPVLGWLCAKAGTVFVARGKLRDVRRIYEGLVHRLESGAHVAFFPEGTTSKQGELLPFHANLFEAAVEAKVPVQSFALRYLDSVGQFHPAVTFIDEMTFMESLVQILKAGEIRAELVRLPTISTVGCHRRELSSAAWEAIAHEVHGQRQGEMAISSQCAA